MNSGTEIQAKQRAAIISEYNQAIDDKAYDLADRIRLNPDNEDIFLSPYLSRDQKVPVNSR